MDLLFVLPCLFDWNTNSLLHTGHIFERVFFREFSCFDISFLLRPNLVVGGAFQDPSFMNNPHHRCGLWVVEPACDWHPFDFLRGQVNGFERALAIVLRRSHRWGSIHGP